MRVDEVERERRVHVVSLMLRRKSTNFIIEYIRKEWRLQKAQAYNYIKSAKEEWEKYFSQVKRCGMSYHVAQLRDLKDQAYSKKVVIGKGKKTVNKETGKVEMIYDNRQVIEIADLGLVFEITKEEAKLMGIYPASKIEGNLNLKHSGEIKSISEYTEIEKNKELERINDKLKHIKKIRKIKKK